MNHVWVKMRSMYTAIMQAPTDIMRHLNSLPHSSLHLGHGLIDMQLGVFESIWSWCILICFEQNFHNWVWGEGRVEQVFWTQAWPLERRENEHTQSFFERFFSSSRFHSLAKVRQKTSAHKESFSLSLSLSISLLIDWLISSTSNANFKRTRPRITMICVCFHSYANTPSSESPLKLNVHIR